MNNSRGFTLLEVLISIALLLVISIAIYQATTSTYRIRDSLIHEGDFYNGIRLAMGVMERDINLIYSPLIMVPQPNPSATPDPASAQDLANIMSQELGRQSKFWAPAFDRTGIRPSRLIGSSDKLSFVTASHVRVYKGTAETEFLKVSYDLAQDRVTQFDPKDKVSGARVLVRTSSTNAFMDDDDRDTFKRTHNILFGILKLSYRYYQKARDRWLNAWDSDGQDTKNEYPDIIEVSIEVAGPARLRYEGAYLLKTEIPLRGLPSKF
jgi:prepilin-type N-terminal cleavage/methylation domain-containing protein